jgi:NAD(P)-dependent dehydrogenase (short-subunit alcohol dehydrogenase family)
MKSLIISGTSRGLGNSLAKFSTKFGFSCYFGASRWSNIDISNHENVKTWFNYINNIKDEAIPKPSLLINNAGVCVNKSILETDAEDWRYQIDVNLNGAFYCSKEYIKYCIKNKIEGTIVNICSTAGTGPRPGRAGYSASKSALINFSLSMAQEIKPYNMRVFIICPGAFDTEMRREIAPDDDFQHMLKCEHIAEEIFKIVESKFLDGQIIYIK